MASKATSQPKVDVRLSKSDLPRDQRQPIHQAVVQFYNRHLKDLPADAKPEAVRERLSTFSSALKEALDAAKALGPDYQVAIGKSMAFASKNRQRTVGMWGLGPWTLLIWKAPSIEAVDEPQEISASPQHNIMDSQDDKKAENEVKLTVLVPAEKLEEGASEKKVIELIKQQVQVHGLKEEDSVAFSKSLRKTLSSAMGTIWHIIVSEQFAVAPALGARNFVTVRVGKLKIACWQYEQPEKPGFNFDWENFLKHGPYGLCVILFFLYVTFSNLCGEGKELTGFQLTVRDSICSDNWESIVISIAVAALGLIAVRRTKKSFARR